MAACVSASGFLNLSAQFREQARTIRAGIDQRTGHYGNPSIGDPSLHRQALAYNAGVALDDNVELYSFATYTHRSVSSAQIYQLPSWRRDSIRTASPRASPATRTTIR